jgi:hypothetical protein
MQKLCLAPLSLPRFSSETDLMSDYPPIAGKQALIIFVKFILSGVETGYGNNAGASGGQSQNRLIQSFSFWRISKGSPLLPHGNPSNGQAHFIQICKFHAGPSRG